MKAEEPRVITQRFLADYLNISIGEASAVHKKLKRMVYHSDEVIVTIGDKADGLYFIDEGQATVYNGAGEAVNEMQAGQFFGEYAILADEPRLSTVRSHGRTVIYRMEPEDYLAIVAKHPKIAGRMLRQVYGQVSVKHTRIVSLSRKYRGIMRAPVSKKESKRFNILATYGITLIIFILSIMLAPHMTAPPFWWQLMPVAFLMAFTLWTRRILEGMILTLMLLGCMLYRGEFLFGFGSMLVEGFGNPDTAQTVVIMAMVEAMSALLASAGVVTAFKKLAERYIRSHSGSLLGMLFIMVVVSLDECLNVMTAGFCLTDIMDRHRVPRETRALLGSCSEAICSIIPFSLWSAYISGWVSMYFTNGGSIFLRSIPFNLSGIFALVFALCLCFGVIPQTKQLKAAMKRVRDGGSLWPDGSETFFATRDDDSVVGRPMNLFLPMLVWAAASVVCGMLKKPGGFAMDPVTGLVLTLIFVFLFYTGQRLLTPRTYFEIMADGFGNAILPILLFVLAERISVCLEELGFDALLEIAIPSIVGGRLFLIPMVLFALCTLMCLGMGSSWGMYGLGIPIAMYLSVRLGLNIPLCLGAVFAAGIIGNSLCPYIDETSPVVTAVGCAPVPYRKLRIGYWTPIACLCAVGYIILGLIFI